MTSRRHSPRQRFALLLVLVLALRLAFTLIDLVCRAIAFCLLRVCWLLEWCIGRLTLEPAARPTPAASIQSRRVIDSGRTPVPPTRDDELARFMAVLGTKDRGFAQQLLASGTRVRS